MPRFLLARPSAPRRAGAYGPAAVLAACAALAAAAPAARAQSPVTLTFDGLTDVDGSGVRNVSNCYEEGGFRVTVVGLACGTDAALATWTADSPLYYSGSPALFNNLGPSVDLAQANGGAFSLQSIGLASFLGAFGNPTSVMFTGMLAAGGMVTQMVQVPGAMNAPSVFGFANFTGLSSVRLTVTAPTFEPYVQFDNVVLTAASTAVIPEPATVALFGAGLAGLGVLARRRQRARGTA
jgi:hypothetical protein